MGKKKTKLQRAIEDILIRDVMRKVQRDKLANPALGTHALVMFAFEYQDLFRAWVNEDAGMVPGDNPKTAEEVETYLNALHAIVHKAMTASLINLPDGGSIRLVSVPRHVEPTDTAS